MALVFQTQINLSIYYGGLNKPIKYLKINYTANFYICYPLESIIYDLFNSDKSSSRVNFILSSSVFKNEYI